jgi:hypothetical protein
MANKSKLIIPIAKCHVEGCREKAAYGFRQTIDASTITTSEFHVGVRPNWCEVHDDEQRPRYANMNGDYVEF